MAPPTISASFTDADTLDNAHTYSVNTTGTLGLVTNNNDGTFGYSTTVPSTRCWPVKVSPDTFNLHRE
jgi:VCBS repeat-containing protein